MAGGVTAVLAQVLCAGAEPIERARIVIVDADTVRVDGTRVRLVGFDSPETRFGEYRCDHEREWGERATHRLAELLDTGELGIKYRRHRDRYHRPLARLTVNGEDVGRILIRERLAVRYKGYGPKMDWCPRGRR